LAILKLTEKAKLYGDAAIGIVSSLGSPGVLSSPALPVVLISTSSVSSLATFLAISQAEVLTSIALSILVLLSIIFFYHEHFATAFDEEFAKISGIDTKKINAILVLLTGVTVVLTMKIVGNHAHVIALILPSVTALQIARSFKIPWWSHQYAA